MRQSSREVILDAALALMRRQEPVSLDTVAHAAGLTKPGLMYHFKTKEALMLAVVDRVADDQKRQLEKLLADVDPVSPWPRLTAYVRWMLAGEVDEADLAMMADPRLRERAMGEAASRISAVPAVRAEGAAPVFERAAFVGIGLMIVRRATRKTAIPFGPFMVVGAWIGIFAGECIARSYTGLLVG